jgi:glycosyltransferase involved in cell wall biosynthesis
MSVPSIALISQFYPPEPCAAANRVAAMAQALAGAGFAVHVYTAMPSFPEGTIAPAYRGKRHAIETDGAIVVERVATYAAGASSPGNRVLNWLSVAAGITARVTMVRERFDAVIVSSPPISLAAPALAAAFAHVAPLIVDVRDVFPDVAIKMGAWKSDSPIARSVGRAADALYARAALVTPVTETGRTEILARGVDPAKVVVTPNGFDALEPAATPPYPALPGVRDIVYVGNMGLATGLDVVLDAARALHGDPAIRFVMIGGGVDCERLRARVRDEALDNVTFTGTLARADALRALTDAALTVVPLVATIVDSLPTKLFDAMLVGTPIVLSAAGEAQRLVERSGAGLTVAPGDGAALAAGIRRVLDDAVLAAGYRANGPAFVRANYDRGAVMAGLAERLRAITSR